MSKLSVIDRGHFLWEDSADESARLVRAWWGGGYSTVNRRSQVQS